MAAKSKVVEASPVGVPLRTKGARGARGALGGLPPLGAGVSPSLGSRVVAARAADKDSVGASPASSVSPSVRGRLPPLAPYVDNE